MKFKLHASAQPTLRERTTPGGTLSGTLFFEVNGIYFPAENWGDYVLPVLGWWIENATKLSFPGSEVKNIFMDGSYSFRLYRRATSDDVRLTLYRDDAIIPGEYMVSYRRLLAEHRGAAKSVINEIKSMGLELGQEGAILATRLEHLIRLEADIKAHGLR